MSSNTPSYAGRIEEPETLRTTLKASYGAFEQGAASQTQIIGGSPTGQEQFISYDLAVNVLYVFSN